MKKLSLFLPFILLFHNPGFSQERTLRNSKISFIPENPNQMEFHVDLYSPTGAFATILDGASPTGVGLNYLRAVGPNLSFGVEIGVAMYYDVEYNLQTANGSVPVYEEDCFWHFRALARYNLLQTENFKTFGEFRLGATNFFSDVHATVDVNEDVGKTVGHGNSLMAGLGLGAEIGFGAFSYEKSIFSNSYFSVRTAYNFGSPTYYRSAKVPSGQANDFEKYRYYSEISYFDVNFGLGLRF